MNTHRHMFRVLSVAVLLCTAVSHGGSAAEKVRMRTMVPQDVTADELVRSLTPVGVGTDTEVSVAAPVTFAFNSAELTEDASKLLDTISSALKTSELAAYRFLVEGHTDAKGSDAYNLSLSKKRAEAVFAYLVKSGIAKTRLTAVGYGEQRLLEGEKPDADANRRVEVVRIAKE